MLDRTKCRVYYVFALFGSEVDYSQAYLSLIVPRCRVYHVFPSFVEHISAPPGFSVPIQAYLVLYLPTALRTYLPYGVAYSRLETLHGAHLQRTFE